MNSRELAAAYLLGELGADERDDVDRRLEGDPELRAEVDAMRPLLATLEEMPREAWPAEQVIDGEQPETARSDRRWSVRPALAVAALLVTAVLGAGLGVLIDGGNGESSGQAPAIILRPLEPTAGETATVAMPRPGEMVLRARGLPPSASGQYYELWLMTDAQRTVPIASFRVGADGRATVRVPLPADPSGYRYFDVSLQKVNGGTGHSADSILRGPTT
jgi:anti-sigma-K factor RskA